MIKTGIYGILRSLPWLGPPPAWWGSLLVALGIGSAVMGILMAHGRKDIKRILAYSSIENIGIIAIGLGLGIWGLATNHPNILALGIAGALCHVWNHALFKGLWFLGAGCLAESTGTRIADRLGGLAKKMPSVAASSGVATIALCGVPPLNGFVGECLIYFGLFLSVQSFSGWPLALAVAGIGGMALTGGLALALFSKLYGTIFLGEPRTPAAASPHLLPRLMRWPLLLLAALCLLLGAVPLLLVPWLESALISWAPPGLFKQTVDPLILLYFLSLGSQALWLLMILLYACTRWLTHRRSIRRGVTWDCGYHAPTPRMQYTAASFSEPITFLSSPLLRLRRRFTHPEGFFPPPTSFQEQSEDLAEGSFFKPLFEAVGSAFAWLRARQQGRVQNYLIWIFLTLLVLLFWEVWIGI
jgi:NADH:ubiquinone oxidoreductase subunit 5 (subunit L)/multisubunit Na+/H+ antiporter MnhA subunit